MVSLAVIVPTYNEAARVARSVEELRAFLAATAWKWELRVVDDGSTDDTVALAERAAAGDPRVLVQRRPHLGKGATVRAGMLASQASLRFMCDCDLSMPLKELPRFLPPLLDDGFDLVIGTREGKGARRVGEPLYRHLMGRAFNRVARSLLVRDLADTQCGFKMFTARAAADLFGSLTLDGWAFDVELLHVAQRRGLRILELPIEWHYSESSSVKPVRDALAMARDVVRVRRNTLLGAYEQRRRA